MTEAVKVKVLQELSYRGKPVKIGDIIEVTADEAEEYATHGWAEEVAAEDLHGGTGSSTPTPGSSSAGGGGGAGSGRTQPTT